MKKTLFILLIASAFCGCKNANKDAEKSAAMKDVMAIHEKVMDVDGQVIANRMKLDTLLKQTELASKDTAEMLKKKLSDAEDSMENWMHHFDYEQKGKSDDEVISYMKEQKKLITAIDSQLNVAVAESNQYLKKIKSK
ncbi:MAG TPA: hypothetical protein VHA56_12295 [Mucilaginibacter sp.]|nr:hypothetical protein [Mucilaginibacter sp.]